MGNLHPTHTAVDRKDMDSNPRDMVRRPRATALAPQQHRVMVKATKDSRSRVGMVDTIAVVARRATDRLPKVTGNLRRATIWDMVSLVSQTMAVTGTK